jgi:hypothetical protein
MRKFLVSWILIRSLNKNRQKTLDFTSVADPGSGIGCLFDPWIRDPGWEKVGIRIRDKQPGSYFFELRNHFFAFWGLKYLNSLMRIRDPGSGMEKSRIRDPG